MSGVERLNAFWTALPIAGNCPTEEWRDRGITAGRTPREAFAGVVDPISHTASGNRRFRDFGGGETGGQALLVARQGGRALASALTMFGFKWFLPTICGAIAVRSFHVMAASLFVIQVFALTTPLFFQVIVDKVLTHRGYETLSRA